MKRPHRWLSIWICLLAVVPVALAATAQAQTTLPAALSAEPPPMVTYRAPVGAVVVDGFRPPAHIGAPGNRGLEYATVGGELVAASAPGQVVFAGQVAGDLFVTVQHPDGLRSSYSHLQGLVVSAGQSVAAGTAVGQAKAGFHFGVRVGTTYLDPAILLQPAALASSPAQLVALTLPEP